ncbi:hypothetical protein BpHYR1_013748 [Brachionus plicatilis]|uniref:Uncharacterized protein n=1 Tax=Brachionus plicatilis TaxID=10195 RepID=A0A3M7PAJ2_BRAPC|nr:hypothetical protein BpHYR1_013748 [Brachionus plicatilis]
MFLQLRSWRSTTAGQAPNRLSCDFFANNNIRISSCARFSPVNPTLLTFSGLQYSHTYYQNKTKLFAFVLAPTTWTALSIFTHKQKS